MNDTKHIWRVFLLVLIAIAAFMVGRLLFVPKTFGQFGHYRAANVLEQRAFPVKYQGAESCEPCHADEFALWKNAGHKTIVCEDCHAPYDSHIKNDEKFADMEINRTADFCLRCHQKLTARPEKFPQVNAIEHLAEFKMELTDTVCFKCHGPHDPTPKDPIDKTVTPKTIKELKPK
ncbi:MAG: cytochrome c3 family protein [Chitinivibrionales bacterium]|nr:cytochrome c3 family protein [Chitinivibrionales bacterium]